MPPPYPPRTPLPDDDTPLMNRPYASTTDAYLRMHLKAIGQQVGDSIKQNDAILGKLDVVKEDVGGIKVDLGGLRVRSDNHDRRLDDLDQGRRWAVGALVTSLLSALGALIDFIFHTPKG